VGSVDDAQRVSRDSRREARRAIRRLLTLAPDNYEGADQANAARLVAFLWMLSGLLAAAFLPFDNPTASIGGIGWAVAAGLIAMSFLGAVHLLRRSPAPGFNHLLLLSYFGLVQVGVLQWLAGGGGSAYQELYLIWIGSAMGVHPPRRALAFLVVALAAAASPLAYDGWSSTAARELAPNALLWTALGIMVLTLMVYVRAQRVHLQSQEEKAQSLARADALTGLGNRRALDEAYHSELVRTQRTGAPLSVVLIDIDGFKQINDEFGHLEGDTCLRRVAETVREELRGTDRGFRWGGDEFAMLLAETEEPGAIVAGERLAAAVRERCADPRDRPIHISWGVAQASDSTTLDALISTADRALMGFKQKRGSARSGAGRAAP
jgi:diguanylate cyclase (GGDEF)-like protein